MRIDIESLPHGARILIGGERLVMDRDGSRPVFECFAVDGKFTGFLYPHNVFDYFGTDEFQIEDAGSNQ